MFFITDLRELVDLICTVQVSLESLGDPGTIGDRTVMPSTALELGKEPIRAFLFYFLIDFSIIPRKYFIQIIESEPPEILLYSLYLYVSGIQGSILL